MPRLAAIAGTAFVLLAASAVSIPARAAPAQAAPTVQAAQTVGQTLAAPQVLAPPGLFAWGEDFGGALGDGRSQPVILTLPESISLAGSVRQISAAGFGGAALLTNGTVETWGDNAALGDGSVGPRPTPAVVPGLTGIVQIANTGGHMLALDSGGRVWSWGNNAYGEIGNGTTSQVFDSDPTPVPVPGLTSVVQVAAGAFDSFAVRSDGTVWAWGLNSAGQLGDGTTTNRDVPTRVPGVTGVKAITASFFPDLSVSLSTTFAIRTDGSVLAWGDNTHGLLGIGTTGGYRNPAPVPGLTGVTQIAASGTEALAVAGPAGTVWAWGDNGGAAGDGTSTPHYSPTQTGLAGVSQVTANNGTSAAVLSNGAVMTWGSDLDGQLGIGSEDNNPHYSPVLVPTLAGASQISDAGLFVMAVASPAPRIPSVVGDIQSTAAADLQAAGYVLGRVSVVIDLTCEYIGVVKAQSPAAGTIAAPGTSVSVSIGKAGGKCLG